MLQVRGVVVDQDVAVSDVAVSIEWPNSGRASVKSAADGAFELAVPRRYAAGRLVRAKSDRGRLQAYGQLPGDLAQLSAEPLRLQLAAAKRVEVHVKEGGGRPIEDATVGILGLYELLESATTDADGKAILWTPRGIDGQYLFAFSMKEGIDFRAYVLRRGEAGDTRAAAPPLPDEPIELTLAGKKPVRVRVTDDAGKPLAGIPVYPWLLKKPGEPDSLNLSYIVDLVQSRTDENGVARFPWIPAWQRGPLVFWPSTKEYVHRRGQYHPDAGDGTLHLTLDRHVRIAGRVTGPDGAPAEGVDVLAVGANYEMDGFRGATVTDADGRYDFMAAPNMVYLVIARDARNGHWAAAPQTGFALLPGAPRENVDFNLRRATRLFGRVTVGPDREPVDGQSVEVYQYGDDANNMPGVDLPNPENSSQWVQPVTVIRTVSDADGRFELHVGPGKFDIRGPQQVETAKFTIADETRREFNFHSPRRERGLLRGLVVVDGAGTTAAGAQVTGIYRHPLAGHDLLATADDQGKFEVERELHRTVLHARSTDGRSAGVAEIGADDKVGVVVIRPMTTAKGRLIDANGSPMPSQEITFGTRVHMGDDNAAFRTSFGGTTTTDDAGRFTLEEVILDVAYEVSVTVQDPNGQPSVSWRRIGAFNAAEPQQIELGDLRYNEPK